MKRSQMQRMRTAWHEAGHAVACVLTGRHFKSVVVLTEAEDEVLGFVSMGNEHTFFSDTRLAGRAPSRRRSLVEREMMIEMAGPIAEDIHRGRKKWDCSQSDIQHLSQLIAPQDAGAEATDAYLRWLWLRTRDFVRRPEHLAAIKAVAESLMTQGPLKAVAVRKIARDAIQAANKI